MAYLNLNFDYNGKSYIARAEKIKVPALSSNNYNASVAYRIFSFHPNDLGLQSLTLSADKEKHVFYDTSFHLDLNALLALLCDAITNSKYVPACTGAIRERI